MTQNFDQNKVTEFQEKINLINEKLNSNQSLTTQDKQQLTEYYNYLKDVGIFYGEVGYGMVNNVGDFGILGNRYFEIYLQNNTNYTKEQISSFKDQFMVKLALADSDLRSKTSDGFISNETIDSYHFNALDYLHIDREAYGGSFLNTFGGSGTAFDLSGFDTSLDVSQSSMIWALAVNETKNGVNAWKAFNNLIATFEDQPVSGSISLLNSWMKSVKSGELSGVSAFLGFLPIGTVLYFANKNDNTLLGNEEKTAKHYIKNSDGSIEEYDGTYGADYVVQKNDTLSKIASDLKIPLSYLISLNPWLEEEGRISKNGNYILIKPNEKLKVIPDDNDATYTLPYGYATDEEGNVIFDENGNAKYKNVNQEFNNALSQNNGQTLAQKAENWLRSVGDDISGWLSDVGNTVTSFMKDVVSKVGSSFDKVSNWFSSVFSSGASDHVYNSNQIDNSLLNLDIRTDSLKGFLSNQDTTQTGNAIGDGDWEVRMPLSIINGDGYKNVASAGIVTDFFNPGRQEQSTYQNFAKDLGREMSNLDKNIFNSQTYQNIWNSTQLNVNLSNLTNFASNARTFLNIDPVVLDLNGDGVKLTSYNDSEVVFDVDNDGKEERTGWVSSFDGMLVDDQNGNGKIDNITETISEYYKLEGSDWVADADGKYSSDGLAALKKLDSNNDGKFNNLDEKWNDLRVWVDANSDARTDVGELKTLEEAGISEIDLSGIVKANKERNAGNIIFSRTNYTNLNGQIRDIAAVDFTTNPIGYEFNDVNLGKLAIAEDGTKSLVISNINGETAVAGEETAQNIFGNVGNDNITGDDRDNWLSGGAGSDTLKGGAGDDILIIDSEDKQENIDGGSGRDIVIINSDEGVSFNLSQSHVETVVGGNGDDVLIGGGASNVFIDGGSGDDIIIGGAADDALAGSDGDDYVDGGYGDDVVRGHRGNDILTGGEGNDYLDGGSNDDKIFGGAGNDVIMEGNGNDEIDGGEGYDLVKYSGSYKDYKISRDGANYKVQDLVTGYVDSIKNIEGVRFNDVTLKLIDGNISPLPVSDTVMIQNKKDAIFISKNSLLGNDLDVEGDALTIISVTNSVGGFARLVKSDSGEVLGVQWTPDPSFIGNMSFDYDVKDSKGAYTIVEQRNNDGTSVTATMKARVTFKMESDPTDVLYSKQWYLSEINVQKAWQDYTGEGIKIGVFEKGDFNINHTELDANTLQSYKDDVAFREVTQYAQHKTTVAGVIAAERNGTGIVGVSYDAKLDGYSWDADATGLDNLKNVDIANNSWGDKLSFNDNLLDPDSYYQGALQDIEDSVALGRHGLGTINVFAGGNQRQEGDNVNYHSLQNSRFVIATGSINQLGDLATLTQASTPFSNPGDAILVSAPGSNINSTGNLLTNANGSTFLGEFASSQGTSFSAPIVSGIVALMLQANSNLGYRDVQKILALSARKFDDPNTVWQENGASNFNGGAMHFSHDYGYGIVDAAAAVRLAETWELQSTYYNENYFFAQDNTAEVIPDNGSVIKQFNISNSNMHNIEVVEVEVDLRHLNLSDLVIKLISPNGTESILMDKPAYSVYEGGLIFNFSSRAFLGESIDGDWKLQIIDSVTGDVGYLNSWKLKFYGELNDGTNDLYVYTDEFSDMVDGARGIISDIDGGVDTINAAAVSSDSVINLNAGKISQIAGHDVLISGGEKGEEYYAKQALLPTKQAQLASIKAKLDTKNQTLVAANTEFAGIDAAISAKYSEAISKKSAAETAYNNLVNNELYGWGLELTPLHYCYP